MTDITLHFAPRTRSFTALWLLEELGQPYTLESWRPWPAPPHRR
jgi:glutathione S-transferase